MLAKPTVYDIDLNYVNLAEGEDRHDYEPIFLWYKGEIPCNDDLGLKMRCRNCGRIISLSRDLYMKLLDDYRLSYSTNKTSFDYEKLLEGIPSYVLPDSFGPFDIRYIYDDGSMRIRPIGYNQQEILVSVDGEIQKVG